MIDLTNVNNASLAVGIFGSEVFIKLIEITEIVSQRVLGRVSLIPEIVGESIDVLLHTDFY